MIRARELKAVLDPECSFGWSGAPGTKRFAIVVVLEAGITFALEETLGIGLGYLGTDTYFTNASCDTGDFDTAERNKRSADLTPLEKIGDDRAYAQIYLVFNPRGEAVGERIVSRLPQDILTLVVLPPRPTWIDEASFVSPERRTIRILDRDGPDFVHESRGLVPLLSEPGRRSSIWFYVAGCIHKHFDELTEEGRNRAEFLAFCNAAPEYSQDDGTKIEIPIDQWIENQRDEKGIVSVSYQVHHRSPKRLAELLGEGVDVDCIDVQKKTGLLLMLSKRDVNPAFLLLLAAKADANATDSQGKTASMYAAENHSCLSLLTVLSKNGANLSATDPDGMTARDYDQKLHAPEHQLSDDHWSTAIGLAQGYRLENSTVHRGEEIE